MSGKRPRTARREAERALQKLADARAKLARMQPGGDPARPIEVVSASVIESRAESLPCARCEGALRVHEHRVASGPCGTLREVELRCKRCGTPRVLWFRVLAPS
ncbi:MAG: hypothetical protein OHK0013_41070 [Sandaracinaceae bacterium]